MSASIPWLQCPMDSSLMAVGQPVELLLWNWVAVVSGRWP